jgi:hypothetical protein
MTELGETIGIAEAKGWFRPENQTPPRHELVQVLVQISETRCRYATARLEGGSWIICGSRADNAPNGLALGDDLPFGPLAAGQSVLFWYWPDQPKGDRG